MASIRKSFNFRNGVQVDENNFIVNSNGLVGIGTSVPSESLDVFGNIKCRDSVITDRFLSNSLEVSSGIGTISNFNALNYINIGITSITSGIITSYAGVVTYYGDGGRLLNLPTSQWLDIDVGLGFTSIYAQGFVGIATNDPRHVFQIGGRYTNIFDLSTLTNGVGFSSTGNGRVTGILTAGNFSGNGSLITSINATNISSGTLNNSRLPQTISVVNSITAGSFIGDGSEITDINASNIASGTLNNSRLSNEVITNAANFGYLTVGTSATITTLRATNIAIGTDSVANDISIFGDVGDSVSIKLTEGVIRFGNTDVSFDNSTTSSFDIINYDTGNLNFYNNVNGGSGNFYWINGVTNELMTLTSSGRLGIGKTQPIFELDVVGTTTITSDLYVGGTAKVNGTFTVEQGSTILNNITSSGQGLFNTIGIATNSRVYDFQVGSNPIGVLGGVGINKNGNIYIFEDIKTVRHINSTGLITATTFDGSFDGDGSQITSINADNISSGTLDNSILPSNISVSGSISASSLNVDTLATNSLSIDQIGVTTVTATNLNGSNITGQQVNVGLALSITEANIHIGYGADSANPIGFTSMTVFYHNDIGELTFFVDDPVSGIVSTSLTLS